jgi:hypothetical protein
MFARIALARKRSVAGTAPLAGVTREDGSHLAETQLQQGCQVLTQKAA